MALVLALPLAGCGGGSSDSAAPTSTTSATSPPRTAAAAIGTISRPAAGDSTGAGTAVKSATSTTGSTTTAATTTTKSATGTTGSTTTAATTTTKPATGTTGSATTTATTTTKSATGTTGSTTTAATTAGPTKSISNWVSCTGTSDDTAGAAKAFAAAKNAALTLVVDCPVNIKVGTDIARTIFIDNGTTVVFTEAGKFTVDNLFIPAFVIADSSNITLTNWNVEYDGSLPVVEASSYENNGQVLPVKPGNAFNDLRLTQWLATNRAIVFQGNAKATWTGTTNACAVLFLTGDTSNVSVTGMHLYVPAAAGGNQFIPVAFTLGTNFKSNQTVTVQTPQTGQYVAIPHDITFSNISLDGTYMGWVGGAQNAVFENIQSQRYGDLQDANGANVGGVGKWFAPPHLFYFIYTATGDPALFNTNIQIKNVVDNGVRVGTARDKGGTDTLSGYANSLKLGCVSCSVDTYTSSRPDGLMDVLTSDGLTISNVTATYNSIFTNNLYPGWRFPSSSYVNVTVENLTLTDTAASTYQNPIGNTIGTQGLVLSNVKVVMNKWNHDTFSFPSIAGSDNTTSLDYSMLADFARHIQSVSGTLVVELDASPATIKAGQTTTLPWSSRQSNSCAGSGALAGATGTTGSRAATMTSAGTINFTLECRNATNTASATLGVVVTQ